MVTLRITENYQIVCEWGVVETHEPKHGMYENPTPLVLVGQGFADLAERSPQAWNGTLTTVDHRDGKYRMVVTAQNGTWIYELFPCRWEDDEGWTKSTTKVLVGKWPD